MNNYFGNQLSEEELRRQLGQQSAQTQLQQQRQQQQQQSQQQSRSQSVVHHGEPGSPSSESPILGGDSLDDIIRDNSKELQRRRSVAQTYTMDFGNSSDAFRDFHFSNNDLQVSTAFPNISSTTSYADQTLLSMSPTNTFPPLSPEMMGNTMAFSNLNFGSLGANQASMGLYGPNPGMSNHFSQGPGDPMSADFDPMGLDDTGGRAAVGTGGGNAMMDVSSEFMPQEPCATPQQQPRSQALTQSSTAAPTQSVAIDPSLSTNYQPTMSRDAPITSGSFPPPGAPAGKSPAAVTTPGSPVVSGPATPEKKMIYSKSGFDMLRAFWYVGTRKNPTINLGAVDMSCSFVVCDVTLNDCPIIYVSDNFQNLTGYNRHEIVGKNCRFLQAPDGKVEAGSNREFVDNGAVLNLKQKIADGEEVQQSLINYRKGGKPFLNLLTMIPIPWDTDEIRYFIGFQIDLVECPDAISAPTGSNGFQVDYKHSDIGQYIWTPPNNPEWEPERTLGVDDVSTLLQQFNPKGSASDWHKQSWDKMLLENADDVVHVLSLKGLFLYLSPSCKKVLEYDTKDLVGNSLSSVCHPSDIVPVTRELKDSSAGAPVNIVFRIRRKESGYTWFESHGSLFVEQGKGRKCIILVGRKRPVFALCRRDLEANGGIGDSEIWTKLSASGMFLFVSSNIRSLLDLQPESLFGTSIQDLMRKESRAEFGRAIEKARHGKIVTCRHEVHNRRGQVLQAQTFLYPGDAREGQKPTFLLAQTKLLKASSRSMAKVAAAASAASAAKVAEESGPTGSDSEAARNVPDSSALSLGTQDAQLASDNNIFDELKTTRCTSWQYELRQMEKMNRVLAEELAGLLANKKKRKRRKGSGNVVRDCANCHTRNTPEWRRGPSGNRDLCNSCGLRWAKQTGRVSPRNSSRGGNGDTQSKMSNSPIHSPPLQRDVAQETPNRGDNSDANATSGSGGLSTSHSRTSVPPTLNVSAIDDSAAGAPMTTITEERETPT
ncbi:hypothetical protein MKZ38_009857 [Zalerion maritima]|uniref:White collar 1 protein n=1 Tax=Zalerion maritima TaxID=339359 RepID=A0AAD5WM76_9PEZI|nr:hypothetical protein MKZ38_009857 [Zalerion maritima]